jgi:hypothetical protein
MTKKRLLVPASIILLSPVLWVGGLGSRDEVQARVSFIDNGQRLNNAVGRGVALADFNGDGTLDALVVNETAAGGQLRLYPGDGQGRFSDDGLSWESPGGAQKPVVFDIDGNGTKDVLVGRTAWLNDGHGRFAPDRTRFLDADGATLWQSRPADLNGDGLVDVLAVAMAGLETAARVYLNDGRGRFRQTGPPFGPKIQATVEWGDLNGDGSLDAVISGWRNAAADPCPNRVFFNDGQGRFTDSGQVFDEGSRHSHGLALGDLDKDGDPDLVLVTQQAPFAKLYLNDGKGRFTPGRTLGTVAAEKVALADFDGDGALDIFLACIGPNEIWLNDGRGGFADSGLRLGQEWSWEVAVGDFNGDRRPDLFVVDLGIDPAAPPEKRMQSRVAEVWINAGKTRRP